MAACRRPQRRLCRPGVNGAAVEAILEATKNPVQLGGGIRTLAISRPGWKRAWRASFSAPLPCAIRIWSRTPANAFPGRIAVGIDASGGKVAVEGWAETSELTAIELASTFRRRRRCGDHLHRYRPRRRADRHQLGIDAGAGRCDLDSGHRLRRSGLMDDIER